MVRVEGLELERGEEQCGRDGNLRSGRGLGGGLGLGLGPRRGAVREEEEAVVVAMGGAGRELAVGVLGGGGLWLRVLSVKKSA